MMKNNSTLASLGESSKIDTQERSSISGCAEEEGDDQPQNKQCKKEEEEEIPIDNYTDGSRNEPRKHSKDCKMEDVGDQEDNDVPQNQQIMKEEEEEIPFDNTDGSRNEARKHPTSFYPKDYKMEDVGDQEDHDVEDRPGGINVDVKSEVEEAEISVNMKEEVVPADINQGLIPNGLGMLSRRSGSRRSYDQHRHPDTVNPNIKCADFNRKTCPDRGITKDYQQKPKPALQKANIASDCTTKSAADQKFPTIKRRKLGEAYSCPDCGEFFIYKSSLVQHRQIHLEEKSYFCFECGKQFTQKIHSIRHQRLHTGKKLYKCTECIKLYSQKQSLVRCQKFCTESELFSCPECGENFIRQSHLVTHRKIHKGLRRYTCPDCGDIFTLSSSLVIHQKVHRREAIL